MKSMYRLTFGLLLAASLFAFTPVQAQTWDVDRSHSSITFSVNHFFTPVEGRFQEFDGEFTFDPNNLRQSKADFTIDVTSVNTQEEKRDKHLQSEDFFNAEKFPKMRFVSSRFEKKSANEYLMHGKLTIRDVTKDVVLPFKVLGVADHPMMPGAKMMGVQSEISIYRNDYGVGSGSWAATMVVGDQVNVKITMETISK